MASAASDAENLVFAPISRALSLSLTSSSPVAPDIACTLLMPASKLAATATAAAPAPTSGTVRFLVSVPPMVVKAPPTPLIFSAAFRLSSDSACNWLLADAMPAEKLLVFSSKNAEIVPALIANTFHLRP